MARPDDIPEQGVIPKWAADEAALVVKTFGHDAALIEGAIAGALVKERERCAKVAGKACPVPANVHAIKDADIYRAQASALIAKAIREGHQ